MILIKILLEKLFPFFEFFYKEVIEKVGEIINSVAHFLPKRRERVQHTGLYGYSRGVGKVKLPRAIGFNASFYSLGIPLEFIGTGRGLKQTKGLGQLKLVRKYYKFLKEDLVEAGRFLNKPNLLKLAKKDKIWEKVIEDIEDVEEVLNISLGPQTSEEKEHQKLTNKILQSLSNSTNPSKYILKAALIRRSLG